jgi:hypothetical protein
MIGDMKKNLIGNIIAGIVVSAVVLGGGYAATSVVVGGLNARTTVSAVHADVAPAGSGTTPQSQTEMSASDVAGGQLITTTVRHLKAVAHAKAVAAAKAKKAALAKKAAEQARTTLDAPADPTPPATTDPQPVWVPDPNDSNGGEWDISMCQHGASTGSDGKPHCDA